MRSFCHQHTNKSYTVSRQLFCLQHKDHMDLKQNLLFWEWIYTKGTTVVLIQYNHTVPVTQTNTRHLFLPQSLHVFFYSGFISHMMLTYDAHKISFELQNHSFILRNLSVKIRSWDVISSNVSSFKNFNQKSTKKFFQWYCGRCNTLILFEIQMLFAPISTCYTLCRPILLLIYETYCIQSLFIVLRRHHIWI